MSVSEASDVTSVLAHLKGNKSDYLNVSTERSLIHFLEKNNKAKSRELEVVEFSDSVHKINKRGKTQPRTLIITNLMLYNFLPGKYHKAQRCIPIERLKHIVLAKTNDEILFQVRNDYDYRFSMVRRAEVVEIVSEHFKRLTGSSLKAMFADDLHKLQITKEDLKFLQRQNLDRRDSKSKSIKVVDPTSLEEPSDRIDEKEGWLSKKGNSNNLWRRRYFRLSESNLLYYESRTKGCQAISHGSVRAWKNNRYSVYVREARTPQTTHQLQDILKDPERREALLAFCASIYSEENAGFYVAVDEFRKLPVGTPAQMQKSLEIYKKYLANGAPNEITAPPETRTKVKDAIDKEQVHSGMFDILQTIVLSLMKIDLLPQYLEYCAKQSDGEDCNIKAQLTEADKKVDKCTGCTVKFSLIKRRNFCQHCNLVYCAACVGKQSALPSAFGQKKGTVVRVCDMCFGVLNPNPHTSFPFTYASTLRAKPLNLSAESHSSMLRWVEAINKALVISEREGFQPKHPETGSDIQHLTHDNRSLQWPDQDHPVSASSSLMSIVAHDAPHHTHTTSEMLPPSVRAALSRDAAMSVESEPGPSSHKSGGGGAGGAGSGGETPSDWSSSAAHSRNASSNLGHSGSVSHAHPVVGETPPLPDEKHLTGGASNGHDGERKDGGDGVPLTPPPSALGGGAHPGGMPYVVLGPSSHAPAPHVKSQQEEEHIADEDKERMSVETRYASQNHLEGWLWKEDPSTGAWRRRYFVLDGNLLWYHELRYKGSLPITQGLGVHASNPEPTITAKEADFGGFRSVSQFRHRFNISSNKRVLRVAADTEAEQSYWISALQECIRNEQQSPSDGVRPQDDWSVYSAAIAQEAPEGHVTFVFTDVQNSTKLWETLPEAMNEALEKHDSILRQILAWFNGYEVKTEGDAFMVTFFTPLDAVLWCVSVQKALLAATWPEELQQVPAAAREWAKDDPEHKKAPIFNGIRIRMGIHTGHPSCRRNPVTGRMDYFGPVVNRAARVADSGHGGQIICTKQVHEVLTQAIQLGTFKENVVIEDLGDFPYKGISSLVKIFQISPVELLGRNPFPALRVHGKQEEANNKEDDDSEHEDKEVHEEKDDTQSPRSSRSNSLLGSLPPVAEGNSERELNSMIESTNSAASNSSAPGAAETSSATGAAGGGAE